MLKTAKKRFGFSGALLLLLLLVFMTPVVYTIYLSLAYDTGEIGFSFEQYAALFENERLIQRLVNSCTITAKTLLLQLPLSLLGGIMLVRCKTLLTKMILAALLLMTLLPFQTYMLPIFRILKFYGLFDTHTGLIVFYAFSPLGPLTVYSFMHAIPDEQWEAASLDTSSLLIILFRVILPQLVPMFAALILLCFAESWNTVEPAVILLQTDELIPASVSLNDNKTVSWAASAIYAMPVLLLYVPTAFLTRTKSS